MTPRHVAYGEDASQFGELTRPRGRSHGVVVVIHGGFWKAQYDLDLGRPLASDVAARGWTAWNLEYRRVGNGGGVPQTLDDVRAGIERLAALDVDTSTVVVVGHSAGGHLATWAGGRVAGVTHVIAQAGVLDLVSADRDGLGSNAVRAFLGHRAGPQDAEADPFQQLPLSVPVWCVHGDADDVVPPSQSERYVAAAAAAGGTATLVPVRGDHFVVIDPEHAAWRAQLEVLDDLA